MNTTSTQQSTGDSHAINMMPFLPLDLTGVAPPRSRRKPPNFPVWAGRSGVTKSIGQWSLIK